MRDLKVRIQDLDRSVQELDKAMHKPVEQNGQKKVEVFHNYEEFLEKHGKIKQNESMSMEMVNGVIKKITITSD